MAFSDIPGNLLTVDNNWVQILPVFEGNRIILIQNLGNVLPLEIVLGPDPDVSGNDPTFILPGGEVKTWTQEVLFKFYGEVWVKAAMGNVDILYWEVRT